MLAPVPLQTVCVRHEPPGLEGEALDAHTLAWAERVNRSGAAYLTPAMLDGRWMVRVSIGAEATERAHVEALWAAMRAAAEGWQGREKVLPVDACVQLSVGLALADAFRNSRLNLGSIRLKPRPGRSTAKPACLSGFAPDRLEEFGNKKLEAALRAPAPGRFRSQMPRQYA